MQQHVPSNLIAIAAVAVWFDLYRGKTKAGLVDFLDPNDETRMFAFIKDLWMTNRAEVQAKVKEFSELGDNLMNSPEIERLRRFFTTARGYWSPVR